MTIDEMLRSYKQKTARASYCEGILTQTLNAIRNGISLKKASKQFGIVNSVSGDYECGVTAWQLPYVHEFVATGHL